MRLALIPLLAALLVGAAAAQAGPRAHAPPQTIVSSHIGMMTELQKRGPNAYAWGPDAGGQYLIVGPITGPYAPDVPRPPRHRRGRHHR